MKRRDFVAGAVIATVLGIALEEAMKVDGKILDEDERDIAKQAMAIFAGSSGAGAEPEPAQVAEKGRLAVRAWRVLDKD